jgi:hypothetical protein
LTLAALQGGKNVLQDGSLRDHAWYQVHFRKLKKDFPQVRQAIIHVTAPKQAILDRAAVSVQFEGQLKSLRLFLSMNIQIILFFSPVFFQQRAITTGRIVPSDVLEKAIEQVPESVKILAPMVDYYAEISNAPDVDDIELVEPEGSNWAKFRQQWMQYVLFSNL